MTQNEVSKIELNVKTVLFDAFEKDEIEQIELQLDRNCTDKYGTDYKRKIR